MNPLKPVEYDLGDGVTCRWCPEHHGISLFAPGFWYLRRTIDYDDRNPHDPEPAPLLLKRGLKVWYWQGTGWFHHTPRQFKTPEAAAAAYEAWLATQPATHF